MNGPSSDRNLLLGIVALQMDFIGRDDLIKAMHDWTLDKARPLSEILLKNGALDLADCSILETLVQRHIAHHGGDPEKSLSSLELIVPSRSTLESLDDPDILQSLSKLGVTHTRAGPGADLDPDTERTGSWAAAGREMGGRFRIIGLHDEGGLGSVFLARDAEVNRDVALKQMKEEIAADPQYRARFVFEAEITGNLEHPGIVPVYGKGENADGRPYYAMRFIRGDNLKVAVDRFHQDPALQSDAGARQREFQKLLRRFLVVCETMAYAHSRGVIHRDLKPRNILLGPYGETLVVDWGLAKVVGHGESAAPADATLRPPSSSDVQATAAGSRVGTPGYMSPEQARGEIERLGPATDIYSMGATLYYMLTKQSPFADHKLPDVLLRIERGEFVRPKEIKPGVDRALEAICLKAMSLHPQDRYSSCRGMADDLEQWLADQPVGAFVEPLSTRALRWLRHRKQLVAAAGVLSVVSLFGLIYHDWRLATEKERVEQARDQSAAQLKMTRKALRDLLGVASQKLANFPQTEALRGELAGNVLGNYRKLLESYPGDPDLLLETARVHRAIGIIGRMTGQATESEGAFNRAIEILERLRDQAAPKSEPKELLTQTLIDRAQHFHMNGKTSEAEAGYRLALHEATGLDTRADRSAYFRLKADALLPMAGLLSLRGKNKEAYALDDEAVHLLEDAARLSKASSVLDRVQWMLAIALTDRGELARTVVSGSAAVGDLEKAVAAAAEIAAESDYHSVALHQRTTAQNLLGEVLAEDLKKYSDAESTFERSITLIEPLANQSDKYPFYREALAIAYAGRAKLRCTTSRWPEALVDSQRATTMLRRLVESTPDNPEFLTQMARVDEISAAIAIHQQRKDDARTLLNDAVNHLERALRIDGSRVLDAEKVRDHKKKLAELGR
jgi:serine/threonine protein kinase